MTYDVFYMKPDYFRDGIMGYKWVEKRGCVPKPVALGDTHIYLTQKEARDLEDLFFQMQGEQWSPNGEARDLIKSRGLAHTSMSVGDIAVDIDGKCWMVDMVGFKVLN